MDLGRVKKSGYEPRYYYVEKMDEGISRLALPWYGDHELLKVLFAAWQNNSRIRVFRGDPNKWFHEMPRWENGRYALGLDCETEEGYVVTSVSTIDLVVGHQDIVANLPILIPRMTSSKGSMMNIQDIIRVECSNKIDGGLLWQRKEIEFEAA